MPFVSTRTACSEECVTTETPTTICRQLSGKVHGISFVACGSSLSCPGDPAEVQQLYDDGNLFPFHTVTGELGEPTDNVLESLFSCIEDEVENVDHPFQVDLPYSLENETFWAEIGQKKFAEMHIITQEALGWKVGFRQLSVKDFTENDVHIIRVSGFARLNSGVKNWYPAKFPMFDPECANFAV